MSAALSTGAAAAVGATHRFRAMGVEVEILAATTEDASAAFADAQACFERLERIFTRFDQASELSRLNRAGRARTSPELLELAAFALAARERTAGLVDVTIHDALVAWGYDRTFADVRDRAHAAPPAASGCGGAFHVDERAGTIELAEGTRLDFGGLAKGYAVDIALRDLAPLGPVIVNAGGDLAVTADEDAPWPVGVDTADGSLTLALARGALATSGRDARRWRVGGREAHHLIDPRTGEPSCSDLLRATAWAPTALEAEVHAKMLFLLGADAAAAHAAAHEIPAVLVTTDGATVRAGGLA